MFLTALRHMDLHFVGAHDSTSAVIAVAVKISFVRILLLHGTKAHGWDALVIAVIAGLSFKVLMLPPRCAKVKTPAKPR